MPRAMSRSSATPWGPLYGCLCSPREPFAEPDVTTAEVDEACAGDERSLPAALTEAHAAVGLRAALKRLFDVANRRRLTLRKAS
jgi:hypothetical protein